jgi:hypothetical protein
VAQSAGAKRDSVTRLIYEARYSRDNEVLGREDDEDDEDDEA